MDEICCYLQSGLSHQVIHRNFQTNQYSRSRHWNQSNIYGGGGVEIEVQDDPVITYQMKLREDYKFKVFDSRDFIVDFRLNIDDVYDIEFVCDSIFGRLESDEGWVHDNRSLVLTTFDDDRYWYQDMNHDDYKYRNTYLDCYDQKKYPFVEPFLSPDEFCAIHPFPSQNALDEIHNYELYKKYKKYSR